MKRTLLLAVLLASALTACGDDKDTGATPSSTPASACPDGAPTTDLTKKPVPVVPAGTATPTTTTFTDVVVGKGAEAKEGSDVEVKYVGVLFATCKEFDASWNTSPSQTLPFTIGGGVIPGFSKGTTGMRVGGRRQVLIPAEDGYGSAGQGPIPPDAALIFVIDLVSAR